MTIQIEIKGKVASVIGTPIIVCGNDDYKVRFIFDDEWLDKAVKTARFKWTEGGENKHIDVPFTGSTVDVPALSNITVVQVGVYAGDLQTTTPARVPCVKSILCGSGTHVEPTPDVYDQLIQLIEDSAVQTPVTLAVEERNSGAPFTFWIGTQSEYEALAETVDNCLYLITDGLTGEEIQETLSGLSDEIVKIKNGNTVVSKAASADSATNATSADSATNAANATIADKAKKIDFSQYPTGFSNTLDTGFYYGELHGLGWLSPGVADQALCLGCFYVDRTDDSTLHISCCTTGRLFDVQIKQSTGELTVYYIKQPNAGAYVGDTADESSSWQVRVWKLS